MESYKAVETISEQLRPFLIQSKRKEGLRVIQKIISNPHNFDSSLTFNDISLNYLLLYHFSCVKHCTVNSFLDPASSTSTQQVLQATTMVFFFKWLFGSRPVEENEKYFSKAVSFKIAAHDFGKFDGKPEHRYAFKNKTMSTLGTAGFSSILDKTKPIKDQEGNHRVCYLFEGATNDGQPPILSEDKKKRHGRAAWYALKDWYMRQDNF